MASIVRYRHKNGSVYLYEAESYYDPITHQSKSKRKYLGREDPVTHQLIPTTQKPGRPAKADPNTINSNPEANINYKQLYQDMERKCTATDKKLEVYASQIESLKKEVKELQDTIDSVHILTQRKSKKN